MHICTCVYIYVIFFSFKECIFYLGIVITHCVVGKLSPFYKVVKTVLSVFPRAFVGRCVSQFWSLDSNSSSYFIGL